MADDDPWLQRVTGVCLALPEATRDLGAAQASFRVRKNWTGPAAFTFT